MEQVKEILTFIVENGDLITSAILIIGGALLSAYFKLQSASRGDALDVVTTEIDNLKTNPQAQQILKTWIKNRMSVKSRGAQKELDKHIGG